MNDGSDLTTLADANLAAQLKLRAQGARTAKLLERRGLIGYSAGVSEMNGYLNGMLTYEDAVPPQATLEAADEFLQLLGHGFVMWIRDHADHELEQVLKRKGLRPFDEPGGPAMVCSAPVKLPPTPSGIEVHRVGNDADVQGFALVQAEAFEANLAIDRMAYGSLSGLAGDHVVAFLATAGGEPVATSMILLEQGLGGVYHVGTVKEARGRGLATLCTALATNTGFDLGAKATVLQASPPGERVYTHLGYKTFSRYRWYPIASPLLL